LNLVFTTGADSKLFLNLCILMDSFAAELPEETLHICDFGFDGPHRQFLSEAANLAVTPPHLRSEAQTWKHKASLYDYFADMDPRPDAIVWFDADMVVLKPVGAPIRAMAAEMAAADMDGAACTDSSASDIAGFIAANETPEIDLQAFRVLIDRYRTDAASRYLNTGFFILRSGQFADTWRDETMRQPLFLLYEQNTFNALAGAPDAAVRVLDPRVWNVHGDLLGDVAVDGAAAILHTTSEGAHHTMSQFGVPIGETDVSGALKVFTRPDLMKIQGDHLMHFLLAHQDLVHRYLGANG